MYQHFYGLNQMPFDPALDGICFFAGGQRQEVLDALLYFADRGEKMVVVTGDLGVGKTALITALQLQLPERISRVQLTGPYLMQQELQDALLSYLSIKTEAGEDKLSALLDRLQQLVDQSTPLLIIVDDAHKLSQASLSFLLSLAGISHLPKPPLVQLMLFGLPDLSKMLLLLQEAGASDPAAFRARINPFSIDELSFYLSHRLTCAGYASKPLFEPEVVKALFQLTKGTATHVNRLADQLLMSSYAKGVRDITVDDIAALGYQAQLSNERDDRLLGRFAHQMTKPPVIISLVASLVVGLSLLAGYFISDYLMINQTAKENIGNASIVNSMSIDPPMPESIHPREESAVVSTAVSSVMAEPNMVSPQLEPIASPLQSVPVPSSATPAPVVKAATPPAKALQSEVLPIKPTPVATAKADVQTEPNKQETAKIERKEEVKKPEQQKPAVTPKADTLATEAVGKQSWPIGGQWTKHQQETLTHLKRLRSQGATHIIQLMSDSWNSRDVFLPLARNRLSLLPEDSSFLVSYQLEDGRPRIALVYGRYAGLEAAQTAFRQFPDTVAKFKPMLKRLDSVIAQMERFKPDS